MDLGGGTLTRNSNRRTDGQDDSYIPPKTLFAGEIITYGMMEKQTVTNLELSLHCNYEENDKIHH